MGRQYDPSVIPDTGSFFPDAAYELEIEELAEELSSTNKAMTVGVLRSVGPELVGVPHFENFVLGSDADPNADDPNTLVASPGARALVRLLKKAGVELSNDLDDDCARSIGQHVIGVFTSYMEPNEKKGVPNQYAGQMRNRVQFFALGERELGATEAPAPAAPARRAAPVAARAAAPAPAPVRGRPAAPAPARPAAPAPARAAAPGRAAAPAPRPAAAPAARAAAAPKKEQMLACQLCPPGANQVPRSEFAAHVAAHEAEE